MAANETLLNLENLEAMVAYAKQMEEIRSLERKAAIAEMMLPMTAEELKSAEQIVQRAKENMAARKRQKRQQRQQRQQRQ
jgi:hypothetical protein